MSEDHYRSKGLSSALCYQDAKAAFRWLEETFGFEPVFVLLDADGNLGHSEMRYGDSVVMVGSDKRRVGVPFTSAKAVSHEGVRKRTGSGCRSE